MPLIDDQIDGLQGKQYFTKLDLQNAFHHLSIDETSFKYTSFVLPDEQYEYVKIPFGLTIGPGMFMRFIRTAFRRLLRENKIKI